MIIYKVVVAYSFGLGEAKDEFFFSTRELAEKYNKILAEKYFFNYPEINIEEIEVRDK